jgi:hypothetical protein
MAKGIVTCDGQIINVGDVVRTEFVALGGRAWEVSVRFFWRD